MELWYLECKVLKDRPGVLSEIASLMARHKVNIVAITTGMDAVKSGRIRPNFLRMLLQVTEESQFGVIRNALPEIKELDVTALRRPTSLDMITLKYGLDAVISKARDM